MKRLNIKVLMFIAILIFIVNFTQSIVIEDFVTEAAKGNKDIVELYIKEGNDINARNRLDNTALIAATISGKKDLVEYLLKNGADVNANKQSGGALYQASAPHKIEIAQILLNVSEINLNLQTLLGKTPLHNAVATYNNDLVKLLLEKGAKRDIKDIQGLTPLDYAKKYNNTQACDLILNQPAVIPSLFNLTLKYVKYKVNKSNYELLPEDIRFLLA